MNTGDAAVQASWASTRERGTLFMMRLMVWGLSLPRRLVAPFVYLATAYFFLFGARARAASRDYLARVACALPASGLRPTSWQVYRHFLAFSQSILDKLDAWSGRLDYSRIRFENYDVLGRVAPSGRGALLIGSHLGNLELCRAIAAVSRRTRLNVLMHTRHAAYFSRVLRMAGASDLTILQVTELDATTALMLKNRMDQGEWVVITGDRVPVHGGRTVDVELLGAPAPLPVGPYVLAALLECPVFLIFCLRRAGHHHIYFEHFADRVQWQRRERDAVLGVFAQRFAGRLEHYLQLEPLQWFNFYSFWRGDA